ncbi:MAG: DoxX family membrane protein [Geminicoccaceae bacterium]
MSSVRSFIDSLIQTSRKEESLYSQLALSLRVGLGILFVVGGTFKLSRALDPAAADALVALYVSDKGYINTFFLNYLFEGALGAILSPWLFLTALSTFELLSGIALIAGFLVRPLSLIYGLLLWSFVFSLPVTTSPGASINEPTYMAPAMFVQIRDIALSGLFFILFNLGSGTKALDHHLTLPQPKRVIPWDNLGLLLRLSLGVIFLIGGFFAGMPNIKDFAVPGILLVLVGLAMVLGIGVRGAAAIFLMVILYYIGTKASVEQSLVGNLNAIKREIAFLPASAGLLALGGGRLFTIQNLFERFGVRRQAAEQLS